MLRTKAKTLAVLSLSLASISLVSCGQKNSDQDAPASDSDVNAVAGVAVKYALVPAKNIGQVCMARGPKGCLAAIAATVVGLQHAGQQTKLLIIKYLEGQYQPNDALAISSNPKSLESQGKGITLMSPKPLIQVEPGELSKVRADVSAAANAETADQIFGRKPPTCFSAMSYDMLDLLGTQGYEAYAVKAEDAVRLAMTACSLLAPNKLKGHKIQCTIPKPKPSTHRFECHLHDILVGEKNPLKDGLIEGTQKKIFFASSKKPD